MTKTITNHTIDYSGAPPLLPFKNTKLHKLWSALDAHGPCTAAELHKLTGDLYRDEDCLMHALCDLKQNLVCTNARISGESALWAVIVSPGHKAGQYEVKRRRGGRDVFVKVSRVYMEIHCGLKNVRGIR